MKQQLLDVVVLRKSQEPYAGQLPDGLDNLATHNLITFKSHQETLDDWALKELTGHYVNYRKQVSPSFEKLLPEDEFRLYAVSSRYPQDLAHSSDWRALQDGVFECRRGSDIIRVVVLRQLPETENNSILHLLSASPEKVSFGASHYLQHSAETSTLLSTLFEGYEREGVAMPYTMEQFLREYHQRKFKELSPEKRHEMLQDLPVEERLQGLSPEERLAGLSPEEIERYLQKHKQETAAPKRKKKK
ncbi:MAG: hypothetical protein K8T89_16310 [Planctomycetes bacterium]|nr:hypothetical protein [Planctomycetota bacterium]